MKGRGSCWGVREQGRRGKRKEIRKRKKEKGEREGEWDTCQSVGGWEKIRLSSPSQPGVGMWQEKITFYFKTPFFNIYIRIPILYYLYHLRINI
jgi:hypothetical protein